METGLQSLRSSSTAHQGGQSDPIRMAIAPLPIVYVVKTASTSARRLLASLLAAVTGAPWNTVALG